MCAGCESLTSCPSRFSFSPTSKLAVIYANTCPDNRSENKPSHVKVVSKRDSGKTSQFFVVFVFLQLRIYGMCLRVFLLFLVKTRFVKVSSLFFIYFFNQGHKIEGKWPSC